MKGTEKQIKWAEEIRANIIKTLERALCDLKNELPENDPQLAQILKVWDARIAALNTCEYADDIIELFKGVKFTGDYTVDSQKLMPVYRVSVGYTEGQKKLLCR